jgi:plasmid maintenance system killer protein
MIKSFADKETEKLFRGGKATAVPPQIRERALSKLLVLNAATNVEDLRAPPGNRLEKLRGDRQRGPVVHPGQPAVPRVLFVDRRRRPRRRDNRLPLERRT